MPADFHTHETKILEAAGLEVLNELGIEAKSNNRENINEPDYILKFGKYMDFQYSNNLQKYGDIRIDTISAYKISEEDRLMLQEKIKETAKQSNRADMFMFLERFISINKKGKYFEGNDIIAVLYFFYNRKFKIYKDLQKPDKILLLSTISIRSFVKDNWKMLLGNGALKLNDKSALGDNHGSAFIHVSLETIIDAFCFSFTHHFNCFKEELSVYADKKLRYLIKV